jgi:hypothetical protein
MTKCQRTSLLAVTAFLVFVIMGGPKAFAACTASVPAGSFQMEACNAESALTESPYATISDANALPLGFFMAWSNAATSLLNGVPVSGPITITNGNANIAWAGNGLTTSSYITLTTTAPNSNAVGSLPSNLPASTLTAQTVLYVVAATTNTFQVSLTPGGTAIVPNASGSGFAFTLVPGFDAWFNAGIVLLKTQYQQAVLAAQIAASAAPAQIPIIPAQ